MRISMIEPGFGPVNRDVVAAVTGDAKVNKKENH